MGLAQCCDVAKIRTTILIRCYAWNGDLMAYYRLNVDSDHPKNLVISPYYRRTVE